MKGRRRVGGQAGWRARWTGGRWRAGRRAGGRQVGGQVCGRQADGKNTWLCNCGVSEM